MKKDVRNASFRAGSVVAGSVQRFGMGRGERHQTGTYIIKHPVDQPGFRPRQGLMSRIMRLFAIIQNRGVPAVGGLEKPGHALFAEFLMIALHHHIKITEQDGMRHCGGTMFACRDGIDRRLWREGQRVVVEIGQIDPVMS